MNTETLHKIFLKNPVICTDTRNIIPNSIFFALKGDSFNGNLFAKKAIELGCAYAIVDEAIEFADNIFKVDDVLECLQQLAKYHRKYLGIPVIGITGSNGKTTTKELVHLVIKKKYNAFATHGNLNNHIGVPLSLLSLTNEHEIAIIEMGANHQGEIEMLCNICLPNYGLITNIGKAHLEGFGGVDGVIKGKSELYKFIRKTNGLLFINHNDDLLMRLARGIDQFTYGTKQTANTTALLKSDNPNVIFDYYANNQPHTIASNLSGSYNFCNILAAVAIGNYFSIKPDEIIEAIQSYKSNNNRSQLVKTSDNLIFLDAYNANPSSMSVAIENFALTNSENKMAILGGMNELGETSEQEHLALIALVNAKNFDTVILVGNHFMKIETGAYLKFENTTDLIDYLAKNKPTNSHILIKGSRTNKLEQLVNFL